MVAEQDVSALSISVLLALLRIRSHNTMPLSQLTVGDCRAYMGLCGRAAEDDSLPGPGTSSLGTDRLIFPPFLDEATRRT